MFSSTFHNYNVLFNTSHYFFALVREALSIATRIVFRLIINIDTFSKKTKNKFVFDENLSDIVASK